MTVKETKKVESFKAFKLLTARLAVESEGVWVEGLLVSVKIKPMNKRNKSLMEYFKKLAAGDTQLDENDDKAVALAIEKIAEHVVVDWKDEEFGGLKYDRDIFKDFCLAAVDTGFIDEVAVAAVDQLMFDQVARAKTEKN